MGSAISGHGFLPLFLDNPPPRPCYSSAGVSGAPCRSLEARAESQRGAGNSHGEGAWFVVSRSSSKAPSISPTTSAVRSTPAQVSFSRSVIEGPSFLGRVCQKQAMQASATRGGTLGSPYRGCEPRNSTVIFWCTRAWRHPRGVVVSNCIPVKTWKPMPRCWRSSTLSTRCFILRPNRSSFHTTSTSPARQARRAGSAGQAHRAQWAARPAGAAVLLRECNPNLTI
jgi:hypothetical protein